MSDLYLLRSALLGLTRLPKLLAALGLIVLPALLAILGRVSQKEHYDPQQTYNSLSGLLIFGFVLVILSVIFGAGIVAQEVEQKTIVYLLTRPIPRWRLLLVQFFAVVLVITATVWLAVIALAVAAYGPAGMGQSNLARDLLVLPVGALAYGGLFVLLSTALARPQIVALLFAFGWDSWVPQLPGKFKMLTLLAYLRALTPHLTQPDTGSLAPSATGDAISATTAWCVLGAVTALTLGAALVLFSVREYVPRDGGE